MFVDLVKGVRYGRWYEIKKSIAVAQEIEKELKRRALEEKKNQSAK